MRKPVAALIGLVFGAAASLYAHDLFLKLESYFLEPDSSATVTLLNGTFDSSEDPVMRERAADISVVSPAGRARLDTTALTAEGDTSRLAIRTGGPGTYVVGVSLRKRVLGLDAAGFNDYLEHDGIPDVLEARRRDGELNLDVRERYSKHVKAIFQVGNSRTDSYGTLLGYPAEIVPLQNPYSLRPGTELRVRCLVNGRPVANQLVLAGGENADGAFHLAATRTDEDGIVRFKIGVPGKWYVKFIHMVKVPDAEADYESTWATLTFGVREAD
ncbi:MAG: DUF4198 domain-containing protein [Gemmatimonadota bacterium]